jgi:hypothetical protein
VESAFDIGLLASRLAELMRWLDAVARLAADLFRRRFHTYSQATD